MRIGTMGSDSACGYIQSSLVASNSSQTLCVDRQDRDVGHRVNLLDFAIRGSHLHSSVLPVRSTGLTGNILLKSFPK